MYHLRSHENGRTKLYAAHKGDLLTLHTHLQTVRDEDGRDADGRAKVGRGCGSLS